MTQFGKYLMLIAFSISYFGCYAQNQRSYSYVDSAEINIKAKNWAKAEKFIIKALEADPQSPNNSLLISNLATVQRYQSKNVESLKNYSIALFMTPNAVTLLQNRASLYMDMDSVDKAYNDYSKILKLDEKDYESRYYHGILALRKKDFETARSDFQRIRDEQPKLSLGIEGMALWNKIKGNYGDAIRLYDILIKAKPSIILLSNRAECYLAMKRLNDAGDDIRTALSINSSDGYLYLLRARLNKLRFAEDDARNDAKLAEKYGIDHKVILEVLK